MVAKGTSRVDACSRGAASATRAPTQTAAQGRARPADPREAPRRHVAPASPSLTPTPGALHLQKQAEHAQQAVAKASKQQKSQESPWRLLRPAAAGVGAAVGSTAFGLGAIITALISENYVFPNGWGPGTSKRKLVAYQTVAWLGVAGSVIAGGYKGAKAGQNLVS